MSMAMSVVPGRVGMSESVSVPNLTLTLMMMLTVPAPLRRGQTVRVRSRLRAGAVAGAKCNAVVGWWKRVESPVVRPRGGRWRERRVVAVVGLARGRPG